MIRYILKRAQQELLLFLPLLKWVLQKAVYVLRLNILQTLISRLYSDVLFLFYLSLFHLLQLFVFHILN